MPTYPETPTPPPEDVPLDETVAPIYYEGGVGDPDFESIEIPENGGVRVKDQPNGTRPKGD